MISPKVVIGFDMETDIGSDLKILEIPNFADMTIESADPYGRDRDQWPLFRTEGAEALMVHIENMLGFYSRKQLQPTFCFYMHPWEFHEMPQGLSTGKIVSEPV